MPATLLGTDVGDAAWLPRAVRLRTGTAKGWIAVPAKAVQAMLPEVTRLVADIPAGSSPEVVWSAGASELLVHTDHTTIACNLGIVQVDVLVSCDQADGTPAIGIPFATGTEKDTRGLFMATFDRPSGPAVVVDIWSEALTAFAWECLLTLASHLAAAAGKDSEGRPLVPAAIASSRGNFLVLPMVRNG